MQIIELNKKIEDEHKFSNTAEPRFSYTKVDDGGCM